MLHSMVIFQTVTSIYVALVWYMYVYLSILKLESVELLLINIINEIKQKFCAQLWQYML